KDDLAWVIRLLHEACPQPREEASWQTSKQGRACKKRCPTGLLRVSRKGEPSPQVRHHHGAHYSRRQCASGDPRHVQCECFSALRVSLRRSLAAWLRRFSMRGISDIMTMSTPAIAR